MCVLFCNNEQSLPEIILNFDKDCVHQLLECGNNHEENLIENSSWKEV